MRPRYALSSCVLTLAAVYLVTQYFVYLYPNYDLGTFAVGVAVPLTATFALSIAVGSRVMLYSGLAFFWALVEDAPVYFDSVFTWPEVTRFNPPTPHLALEGAVHILTALFMVLALREAAKAHGWTGRRELLAAALGLGAYISAYAQNIPLTQIQSLVEPTWYTLDVVEHLVAAVLFLLALIVAAAGNGPSVQDNTPS